MGIAVLSVYLAVGVAVYARILPSFFVADDFAYLHDIAASKSPSIIFSALAERYFRPMVVLAYYFNYQISALDPFSYHLTVVLLNVVNSWLIFLLGRALGAPPFVAPLAGLLFLVFGGHAEAITWIGGMADPLVTMFVLIALLVFLRALTHERPLGFAVAISALFAAALLSKESAAVLPLLLIAATALRRSDGVGLLRAPRLLVITLAGMAVVLAGYLLLRQSILGFSLVNLEGLGTNSHPIATTRAFIIRSFLPQGELALTIFMHRFDILLGLPIVGLLAWGLTKSDLKSLAFMAFCFAIALAPVLPLSIAMATTESERLIYMSSAFASLLLVWFLGAVLQQPRVLAAIVLMCAAGNIVALTRINQNWLEAASIVNSAMPTFADAVRTHRRGSTSVFFLNVPDNVRGAYVFRRGFHEALKMAAPEEMQAMSETSVLSVFGIGDSSVPVRVAATGPRSFEVTLGGGWLLGAPNPPTPKVALGRWSLQSFRADFTTNADGSLIFYFTPQRVDFFGRVGF